MSDKHSHSEDQAMEHLFRTALDGHKESVEEQEADAFLDQLEERGFFKENKKRPWYLFLIIGLFFVTVTWILYSYFSQRTIEDEPLLPVTKEVPTAIPDSITDPASTVERQKKTLDIRDGNEIQPSVMPLKPEQELKVVTIEATPMPRIDSVVQEIRKPDVKSKDSVRVKYVMQVDTIKTVDSLTINKRKWNRMKGKGK